MTMSNTMGGGDLSAEQVFVLRVLQLPSRCAAPVEQRAERAAGSSAAKSQGCSFSNEVGRAMGSGEDVTTVGSMRLVSGESAPRGDSRSTRCPRSSASTSVPRARSQRSTDIPHNRIDASEEEEEGTPIHEEMATMPPTSPTSLATAFTKDAEPVSPHSPMRRMLEMKGARPVRRPRNRDIIHPHRRSSSGSINLSGEGGGGYDSGLSGDSLSGGRRADGAKATLQQAVCRTLSLMGLQASADAEAALPQCGATTAAAETRVVVATGSPTASPSEGRGAFLLDDAFAVEDEAAFPSTPANKEGARKSKCKVSVEAAKKPATSNHDATWSDTGTTATTTTASAPIVVTSFSDLSDAHSGPASLPIAHSFSTFLQRLRAVPSLSSPTPSPVPTPLRYDTDNGRSTGTTATTTVRKVDVDGGRRMPAGDSASLSGAGLLEPTFPGMSGRSSTVSSSVEHSAPSLPLTPPPPYAESPLLHASLRSGTFATLQDLIAHLRLAQPWTIIASRKRYRPNAERGNHAGRSDMPASLTPVDLQTQQQQQPSLTGRKRQVCSNKINAAAAAAGTAMNAPFFLDGEAVLVSDRVDAVLPTWAYLTSHAAFAAPATLASPLVGQPLYPASDPAAPMPSCPLSHRAKQSQSGSFSSPVTCTAAHDSKDWAREELFDLQSSLFPHGLAEACAVGRLQRSSHLLNHRGEHAEGSDTAAAAVPASSLHLLRLELMLGVQQVPPTVCSASAEERQTLLECALEEFSESGVLSTTALRGVLNDAALRLLSSVDNDVLRRIAGDSAENAETQKGEDSTAAPRAEVVPLSLHVHTVQGGLPRSLASSSTVVPQPPRSLTTASANSAADSGSRGSFRSNSVAAAPAVPTQVIITMLMHVCSMHPSSAEDGGEEDTLHSEGHTSESLAASGHPSCVGDHGMTESTALAIAQTVLPHLFPVSFVLSRCSTQLAISSGIDYDALCSVSEGVADKPASMPASTAYETEHSKPRAEASLLTTEREPKPWVWIDVDLSDLRAACGAVEPKPHLPSPCAAAGTLPLHDAGGAFHELEGVVPPAPLCSRSHQRRSKDGLKAPTSGVAASQKGEGHQQREREKLSCSPEGEKQQLEGGGVADGAGAGAANAVGEQLRWDATEATIGLTTTTVEMQRQIQLICEHAQLLGRILKDLEDVKEGQQERAKAQRTRRGRKKQVAQQNAAAQPLYAEDLSDHVREARACATARLIDVTLCRADAHASSGSPLTADDRRTSATSLCSSTASKMAEACVADGSSRPSTSSFHSPLSSWLEPYAQRLSENVCRPLEQLEAFILKATSSTTVASPRLEDANGSVSDGTSSTVTRRVVGSQIMLRMTRRQRRLAAATAQKAQGTSTEAAGLENEGRSDTWPPGDSAAFPPTSLLPSLELAKSMVHLFHEMTDEACVCSSSARTHHLLEGGADEYVASGKNTTGNSLEPPSLLCASRYASRHRSLSTASGASVRVVESSSVVQSLQEHISAVHEALRQVQAQLEAEERRWATLRAVLTCLEAEQRSALEILAEEAAARQELQLACAAAYVAVKRRVEAQRADAAATAAATAAAKEMGEGETVPTAAPPPTVPSEEGQRAGAAASRPISDGDPENPSHVETAVHRGATREASRSSRTLEEFDTTAVLNETQVKAHTRGADAGVGGAEEPTAQTTRGDVDAKAASQTGRETAARSSLQQLSSPALDAARGDGEEEELMEPAAAAAHGSEAVSQAGDNSTAPPSPAPESVSSRSETRWAAPHLPISVSDALSRAPLRSPQAAPRGSIKDICKNNAVKTHNTKRQRNRGNQQTQQHPDAGRSSAAKSPITSSSTGVRSCTSSFSSMPPSSAAGDGSASSGATAAAADYRCCVVQAARLAPLVALRNLLGLYLDSALIRQAAPFMAMGTLLFLVFLLL
ncbi:cysteine peptidase B (CPB) [Leptomonas seymouri]|uniref:Cysteine peptidase B (CPB) n=1 Tax=Leptomonas seymouri TaxID=5684 RepID=A0A0N1I3P6_LEPSE|nr:cysteine peptidase B (CPB) [Leptomonas seymouri]|eukprot:KPI84743.1 cysteine peptidase B (CPB) [Leptomonas seymouri]